MAVTLTDQEWRALTRVYAVLWAEAEDDLEMREMTLDERIALFVTEAVDSWLRHEGDNDVSFDDLHKGAPF